MIEAEGFGIPYWARRKIRAMMQSVNIEAVLQASALVKSVDRVNQYIRCETSFLYPDGSSVDVFVCPEQPLGRYVLSDLAQTLTWLLDLQVKPRHSKRRQALLEQALLEDAIQLHGVTQDDDGALRLHIAEPKDLTPGILSLGQACVRVADLFCTKSWARTSPTKLLRKF